MTVGGHMPICFSWPTVSNYWMKPMLHWVIWQGTLHTCHTCKWSSASKSFVAKMHIHTCSTSEL